MAARCGEAYLARQGQPSSASSKYLYRLTSLQAVLKFHTRRTNLDEQYVHIELLDEYKALETWIPLSRIVSGSLKGRRGLTFWTSFDLLSEEILTGALKLGIPYNHVSSLSLILRCKTKYLESAGLVCVPTVLDGWDRPIFLATADRDSPTQGHTISLESPRSLKKGADEYGMSGIAVDHIKIIPLVIGRVGDRSLSLVDDSPLWQRLVQYYTKTLVAEPQEQVPTSG